MSDEITPAMVYLHAKDQVVKKHQFSVAMWSVNQWNAAILQEIEAIVDDDASFILKHYRGMMP